MTRACAAALAAFCMALSACGGNGSDSGASDYPFPPVPGGGGPASDKNLSSLLRRFPKGRVKNGPWAGAWWPYSEGGTIGAEQLYDQAVPGTGAIEWEQEHHGPGIPGLKSWWGHCNGWAAAAVLYPEPREPRTVSGVTFAVADRKAMLSEIGMEVSADFFGTRVDDSSDFESLAFQDVFPNQFFLVLANYVGRGYPVIIDRYTGSQVWNQPLAGYQVAPITRDDYLGADPAAPNVYRLNVTTEIWWLRDDVDGEHLTEAFEFSDGPSYESRTLRYELWLDGPVEFNSAGAIVRSGNVVLAREGDYVTGGVWRNTDLDLANSHPDYMWVPHAIAPSTGFTNPKVDVGWVSRNLGR